MLKRLALTPPAHQFPQRGPLVFGKSAIKLEVKIDPLPPEHVRKQMFCVQSRALDISLSEIVSARLQHFEDGHGENAFLTAGGNAQRSTLNTQHFNPDWASWELRVGR
jgi:hypothetical protein